MKIHGKSNFSRPKENTKSLIEKNLEDEEFKKYDAMISKLFQVVTNKDKSVPQSDSDYSTKRTPSLGKNKSNLIRLTVSRTKDDRNDKDFLSTFMNNDSLPILPKNLHLLSDNDTNQSISNTEKFKNLSNLMIDDKESYVENCFIRNSEDRLILQLYTTLGRDAKEVFLEEESKEKILKKRLLFHKLNDIKMPKFGFNEEVINKKEEKKTYNEEKEVIKKVENECYFKREEKGYFHIPSLIDNKDYQRKEKRKEYSDNNFNNDIFWDPEIDADILSYINHNIIRIEDIYNMQTKTKNKNDAQKNDIENLDEDIVSVDAQEIISSSESENEEEDRNFPKERLMHKSSGINDEEEELPKKSKVKFSEFCGISPYQVEVACQVDPAKVKENRYNEELKDKYNLKLNKISSYDVNYFPTYGIFLSNDLIFRIATKNEYNEIEKNERFTIDPTKNTYLNEISTKRLQNLRNDLKKKTNIIKSKNSSENSLRGSQFILKKSLIKPQNNNNQNINDKNSNNNKASKEEENKILNEDDFINERNENISNIKINENSFIEENKENQKIDDNNIKSNKNKLQTLNKIFTLKDLLNNDSSISNNDINNNNNNKKIDTSNMLSENDSFSIMNDKNKNNLINDNSNNEQEKNENINEGAKSNYFSRLYSDKQSESQILNNDNKINLSFSSKQS